MSRLWLYPQTQLDCGSCGFETRGSGFAGCCSLSRTEERAAPSRRGVMLHHNSSSSSKMLPAPHLCWRCWHLLMGGQEVSGFPGTPHSSPEASPCPPALEVLTDLGFCLFPDGQGAEGRMKFSSSGPIGILWRREHCRLDHLFPAQRVSSELAPGAVKGQKCILNSGVQRTEQRLFLASVWLLVVAGPPWPVDVSL